MAPTPIHALAHAVHNDRAVNDLSKSAEPAVVVSINLFFPDSRRHNVRNNKRQHDIQRGRAADGSGAGDGEEKPDQPDEGLDAGGDEVEDGVESVAGEEADFDGGQDDAEAAEGEDDAAAGSAGRRGEVSFGLVAIRP